MFNKITTAVALVSIIFFTGSSAVSAGSLTPPGAPANTMYTMTDIFNLSAGTTVSLGSGTIPTTPASVAASFKTLTEIYDAITAQVANLSNPKIANGISAFGYTGTLFGDTNAAKVLANATYPGTIAVKTADNAVTTTSVSGTSLRLTPTLGYYDGVATVSTTSANFIAGNIANGVNLFGVTGTLSSLNTSDATAVVGDMLSPKTAYVNGVKIIGTMPTNTLSSANDTVSAGYYAATTLSAVDTDLAAGNIKSGVTIFGKLGTLVANLYGDLTDATKVLTTASSPGTYNAANLSAGTVLNGTAFGVSQTGTVIQSLGNAAVGTVLAGTTFSNASAANLTGTIPVKTLDNAVTGGTIVSTSLKLTPPIGYYDGTATVSTTSPYFIAGNIKSGINLFGIIGTLVANLYGDLTDATKVLTTASSPGTYNAANLSAGTVLSGTAFGVSQTGTVIQSLGNAAVGTVLAGTTFSNASAANLTGTIPVKTLDNAVTGGTVSGTSLRLTPTLGYYDGVATVSTTSANFIAGNIANGVYLFGVTGTLTSLNTSDATAVVGDMLSPKTAYVNGVKITGTMPTNTLSSANDTVSAGYYAATTLSAVDTNLAAGNIKSGTTIFGKVGTALGAQLIRTNQTICYDASGSVITCAGTGQDGELQKGVARSFTDNANGTITDNNSGLIWQKQDNATTYTWTAALAYCNANTAGLPGGPWRLPNVYELYSLIDFGVAAAPFINGTYFPATQSSSYWSSTTYPALYSYAMVVYFSYGFTNGSGKSGSNYVRCVRG